VLETEPICLSKKVALITGAARGIGRAVAMRLAGRGAAVVITDHPAEEALLAQVAREIEQRGSPVSTYSADIASKPQVDALFKSTFDTFERLDILVNVAGVHVYPSPLMSVTEAQWDTVFNINVKGALFACQAAIPRMTAQGSGSIINIASDSAFDVIAGEGPYGISKIAVVRMASYLAKELAGTGVRVNSLAPGWVRTRLTDGFLADPAAAQALIEAVPARRIAEPEDVAGVVLFLASDLANYVNGHCIVVDGGRVAGLPA
jgi:NAD(P)-dependent dehydrogenase (short-subunit alcohol dehydrogenase family)